MSISQLDSDNVRDTVDFIYAQPMRVLVAERVDEDFDARVFPPEPAALSLPRLRNRRTEHAQADRAWRVPRPLNFATMHVARRSSSADKLPLRYRSAESGRSPLKTLDRLDVTRDGDDVRVDRVGALVPGTSGPLDGRLAGPCRRRRNGAPTISPRRLPPRPPRPTARWRDRTALSGAGGVLTLVTRNISR